MERVGMRRELHAVRRIVARSGECSTSSATPCSSRSGTHASDQRRAEAAELLERCGRRRRYRPDPDRPPVVLALPFTKSWMAVNTPARRVRAMAHFGGQTPRLTSSPWMSAVAPAARCGLAHLGRRASRAVRRLRPADSGARHGRVVAMHDGEPDLPLGGPRSSRCRTF